MDHGHGEAAQSVTVTGREVLRRSTVVSLKDGQIITHQQKILQARNNILRRTVMQYNKLLDFFIIFF